MSKGTKPRAIRISDELWDKAKEATMERGDTISDVVRIALEAYITQPTPARQPHSEAGP